MIRRFRIFVAAAALACTTEPAPTGPVPPPPPPPPPPPSIADVPLRDMNLSSLPAPYYQFEYDTQGKVTFASFASGLRSYEIQYEGNRISAMRNALAGELLTYFYDGTAKVSMVTYTDRAGVVYVRIHLAYAGEQLVRLERERLVDGSFQVDKRLSFVYDATGNLAELTDQRFPFVGQPEATYVDRFEQYDEGINVDGFSLIHNEFFDHLVLLPGLRFQRGNPSAVTRSGSGLNYRVDYTYTYDSEKRPVRKHGEVIILNGTSAGQRFGTDATFRYE